jgi:hypothetical protein
MEHPGTELHQPPGVFLIPEGEWFRLPAPAEIGRAPTVGKRGLVVSSHPIPAGLGRKILNPGQDRKSRIFCFILFDFIFV